MKILQNASNHGAIQNRHHAMEGSVKEWRMLVWLTQIGLNVCTPLVVCTFLSLWLRQRFGLGAWIILIGLAIGLAGAANGLRLSLKMADKMARNQNSHHK